jgi:hypothetical protein
VAGMLVGGTAVAGTAVAVGTPAVTPCVGLAATADGGGLVALGFGVAVSGKVAEGCGEGVFVGLSGRVGGGGNVGTAVGAPVHAAKDKRPIANAIAIRISLVTLDLLQMIELISLARLYRCPDIHLAAMTRNCLDRVP